MDRGVAIVLKYDTIIMYTITTDNIYNTKKYIYHDKK